MKRVDKQEAELALNGNLVKSLCAQGSRAEEQHAILEGKLAEAAVREQKQQSELELLKAERRADGLRQLREFEQEQVLLQKEKVRKAQWPNPYVTPKAADTHVPPQVSAEDLSPEDQAQAQHDADSAKALVEATKRRAFAAAIVERKTKAAEVERRRKWAAAKEAAARLAAEIAERAALTRDSLLAKLAELTEAEARGVPGAHGQVLWSASSRYRRLTLPCLCRKTSRLSTSPSSRLPRSSPQSRSDVA